ncbi:Carboxymuconolactone decarboxylase (fragment) [Paraburkholderia piptadeniae]|uniref:Carboxymuconolactone decarboxylase n=1 Tax=Paraburkholderia piptadeniae TaxID=1701573 RepID=A0A1N7RRQ8_9BURK
MGDVYARPQLDLLSREMVTVAAMGSAPPQLKVHMHGLLNVGDTREQQFEVVTHIAAHSGFPRAISASLANKKALSDRAHAVH